MDIKSNKVPDLPLTILANMKLYASAKPVMERVMEATKDPMAAQEKFLMKILEDAKDTEYGRKYNFADIHSIKDYQKMVPITTFDDYDSYIERMADKGERNLITPYELALYNKSSGTVGRPKRIPMTKVGAMAFFDVNAKMNNVVYNDELGDCHAKGRMLTLTQSAPEVAKEADGLPFGSLSDTAVLAAKPTWMKTRTSPLEASFAGPGVNTRYLHARFGLIDPEVTCLSASYVSFALEFFRYIENNWELLVKDIAEGRIDESIEMPEEVRESVMKYITPMPERAEELRAIFSQGFEEPFARKVWPDLCLLVSGAGGTFKSYAEKMRTRYTGDIPMYKRGISASEGAFSAPLKLDSDDSLLVPDVMFFEFLPVNEEDEVDVEHPLTLDQVEVGKKYELVITNLSGFYRYRMRDIFLIKGMHNKTPMIEYLYRSNKTVSLMGEKTTELALRWTAEETAKACGFELIDSSVYPNTEDNCYDFLMELGKTPEGLTKETIRDALEEKLALANPSMGDKVKKGFCTPTRLHFLQPETYLLYRDMLYYKGYSIGQTKPVTVIANEVQRKFFYGLREEYQG